MGSPFDKHVRTQSCNQECRYVGEERPHQNVISRTRKHSYHHIIFLNHIDTVCISSHAMAVGNRNRAHQSECLAGRYAAGRSRLRHACSRQVQHREGVVLPLFPFEYATRNLSLYFLDSQLSCLCASILNELTMVCSGHSRLHQEGIRQEVQPYLARNCWSQLRLIRDSRNQAFHLLLLRPSGNPLVQVRLSSMHSVNTGNKQGSSSHRSISRVVRSATAADIISISVYASHTGVR